MAIQQGAGYRDPAKSMTIKALQERQKMAASAVAKSVEMPQIADPWQAASHVLGVGAAKFGEAQAGAKEADARARLAGVMAGIDPEKGATMAQIAEMQQLDPDFANKEYERAMAERAANRDREDAQQHALEMQTGTQTFTAGESEKTRIATAEQNELNRQADVAQQKVADANAAGRQDDAQAAAVELAGINAEIDRKKAEQTEADKIEAIGEGVDARKVEAEKLGLKPGTPEYNAYVLRDAAPASGGLNTPAALKDVNEFKLQGTQMDSALNTVSRAEELMNGGNVVGGDAAMKIFELAGSVPGGTTGLKMALQAVGINLTDAQIADTMEFDSIMGLGATEHMANTLKGQSSNMEMQAFRRDMANRNAPDSVKRNAIQRMKNALMSDRGALDTTLQQFQQPAMQPYEYKSSTTTAPAPDASGGEGGGGGGGGGGEEPKEGEVFSSPGKNDIVYKNGQYIDTVTGKVVQ